ncbi:hypothetical protein Q1695_000216 [Nippostrongylus brasiliensis]|nr:hypothetical protein Q1695_000216 [Nippostrongylus brasiliensis]
MRVRECDEHAFWSSTDPSAELLRISADVQDVERCWTSATGTPARSSLLKMLMWTIRVKSNYLRVASIFGNYCRYTVTSTSDTGNRLTSALSTKSANQEQPAVRIKARWQSISILPLRAYDDFLHYLSCNYLPLCNHLEPVLSVRAKEDLATALVRVLHKQKLANDFLCELVMSEVDSLDNDHLMFRGNSLATKAMEAYMKLIADEYLQSVLGDFVNNVLSSNESCEVDPLKLNGASTSTLDKNRTHLTRLVEQAWEKIICSTSTFPMELRMVFGSLRERLESQGRSSLADTLISSSIFLRYLCPAILSPSLFNLVTEYPSGVTARNLTLIAKTLQNLANFTKFGGKEHYMEFMNGFVEREWHKMKEFLRRISTGQSLRPPTEVVIDMGKDLSLLNTYLEEAWTPEVHDRARTTDKRLAELREILMDLHEHSRRTLTNGVSGVLQSPVCQQNSSDYENSPQQILRPRNENVPAYRSTPPTGQATVMSRSRPAHHLFTTDDYVLSTAFQGSARQLTRLNDETGTSSSHVSEKTSSSGDARDTDSETEAVGILSERARARKARRRCNDSPPGSQPASSGYHSNNQSSNSSSSSPIDRTTALSISNPAFNASSSMFNSSGFPDIHPGPSGMVYRRSSPPPYHSDLHNSFSHQPVYAIPPDCDSQHSSLSGKTSLPRTNPRATRNSTMLRPTVIDVVPDDWDRSSNVRENWNGSSYEQQKHLEIIEHQKREIERLIRENEILKRHVAATCPSLGQTKSERNPSDVSTESYESVGSSESNYRVGWIINLEFSVDDRSIGVLTEEMRCHLPFCPSPSDPDGYVYCCQFFYLGETFPSCCRFPFYTGLVISFAICAVLLLLLFIFLYCWFWPTSLLNLRRQHGRRQAEFYKVADYPYRD